MRTDAWFPVLGRPRPIRPAAQIRHRQPVRSTIIDTGPEEHLGGPLPEAVRQQVIEAAADLIGSMPTGEVPAPLRMFARFEARKRAKLAANQIAAQLESDSEFRDRVAGPLREAHPELAEAVEASAVPPAADPVRVAAIAYLLRPSGWTMQVEAVRAELTRAASAADEAAVEQQIAALRAEIAAARSARAEELDKVRGELRDARAEIAVLRHKLHEARKQAKAARESADAAAEAAERESAAAAAATAAMDKELRKLRGRLSQAEAAAESTRRASREGRNVDDVRLRMLLDVL
ncbi:RNA-binding protein, partial [Actinomadura sp. HBU206391]|nr:RNA-binding protein [Actinomadura sp. HBU206391]